MPISLLSVALAGVLEGFRREGRGDADGAVALLEAHRIIGNGEATSDGTLDTVSGDERNTVVFDPCKIKNQGNERVRHGAQITFP